MSASVLLFDDLEELGFVDQDSTADAPDCRCKSVRISVEDDVAQPAQGWPRMMMRPCRRRNEPRLRLIHELLHKRVTKYPAVPLIAVRHYGEE